MSMWLLLECVESKQGQAVEVVPKEPPPGGKPMAISLGGNGSGFTFNTESQAKGIYPSAQSGGEKGYELLWREGTVRQKCTITLNFTGTIENAYGHSGDLLFALAVVVMATPRPQGYPPFAATGRLTDNGIVDGVDAIPAKLEAALATLPQGGMVFYPVANNAEVDDDIRQQAQARGIELCAVAQLDEAVNQLGIATENSWIGNPYLGLDTFKYEHRRIYFGHEEEATQLRERLQNNERNGRAGLLILGASGAGKSSFAQAGLIPGLVNNLVDRPLVWSIWRPREAGKIGRDEAALAQSIASAWANEPTKLADSSAIIDSFSELVQRLAKETPIQQQRFVWLVDQMEELFISRFTPEAITVFAKFLVDLQCLGVWVLATLRDDFYPQYQKYFRKAFPDNFRHDLSPIETWRRIIEEPARLRGLSFVKDKYGNSLSDRLLKDMKSQADALPLLEFTLHRLYEESARETGKMKVDAYEALGCLHGAIGRHAEKTFNDLKDAKTKAALPRVLSRLLVTLPESSDVYTTTVRRDAFAKDAHALSLIDILVNKRLLVSNSDSQDIRWIRLTHEALLEHWGEAKKAVAAKRDEELNAQRRRTRLAISAAITGGLLATIAIGNGYLAYQRNIELKKEKEKTNAVFQEKTRAVLQLKKSIDKRTYEIGDELKTVPGTQEIRRKLFYGNMEDLGKLEEVLQGSSVEVEREKAMNLQKLGDEKDISGDSAGALREYQSSLAIVESILARYPNSEDLQRDLSLLHERFGKLMREQNNLGPALEHHKIELEITRRLAETYPHKLDYQNLMAVAYINMADVQQKQGKTTEAMNNFQASLTIREKLASQEPDNTEWQEDLATIHSRMGALLMDGKNYADALHHEQADLAIIKRLLEKHQGNALYKHNLAITYSHLAELYTLQGKFDEALQSSSTDLSITQELAKQEPDNARWQWSLSISHEKLGDIQKQTQKLSEAEQSYQAAKDIRARLTQLDPKNTDWEAGVAIAQDKLGDAQILQGKMKDAVLNWLTANALFDKLAKSRPDWADNLVNLASNDGKLAVTARERKEMDDAFKYSRHAVQVLEQLLKINPDNTGWQQGLAKAKQFIADIEAANQESRSEPKP